MVVEHNIAVNRPTKGGGDCVNKEPTIGIHVEFTGGLELLFSNKRQHKVALPCADARGQVANLAFLVQYLCDNIMKDRRKEMFVLDGTVRPGILVLVNDADWELEGGDQYELQENDAILFVSTLHGG